MHRTPFVLAILAAAACSPAAERPAITTAVIAVGESAQLPVPVLLSSSGRSADAEVADLMFLRLAALGPTHETSGDRGFEPQLASGWTRRDSVTLAFDLDSRARWHDGQPVTARDVVFTFGLARDTMFSATLSGLLHRITDVSAEGDHRVVVRFAQPYAEQLYDAAFHVQPLPAHLLQGQSLEQLLRSDFVRSPVGNGPYRWVRSDAGKVIELAADPAFFLGTPGIGRVLIRTADDGDARLNMLLAGEADALMAVVPPLANVERVNATGRLSLVPVPSTTLGYLLFNQRDPTASSRPHPILSDVRVRRALVLALDRRAITHAVLGPYGSVPYGPVSSVLWISRISPAAAAPDTAEARRLLAAAGWRDSDGDGIADRGGRPLRLSITVPAQSTTRKAMAALVQEQLRQAGVQIDLAVIDGKIQGERRKAGQFDIDFSGATQDPTPAGLTQSWTCHGGSNVAHFCDAVVDSLITLAIVSPTPPNDLWTAALDRLEADAPAAFMYTPVTVFGVSNRFAHVDIRPESPWVVLWRWSVKTGRDSARSR